MAKKKDSDGYEIDFQAALKKIKATQKKLEDEGIFTRLVSIQPKDDQTKFVDVFVTEITRVFLPKQIMLLCPKCDKLQLTQDLKPQQAIKLRGRTFKKDDYKFYIRKNFKTTKCPKCKDNDELTFRVITYQDALELEIRDVHLKQKSHEFELERAEVAYYIPKNPADRDEFLRMIEHGQSIRVQIQQIMKHLRKHAGERVFWVKNATLSQDIIIDDKIQDPKKLRNMLLQGMDFDNYTVNVSRLIRSFAQWIGGMDYVKEWIIIWGFSCPTDPWAIMSVGDSQVSKSHLFTSFLSYHNKRETPDRDKAYLRDVILQGENLKRTAFYHHTQVEKAGETRWVVRRGIGLRSKYGRLFIDSFHRTNKEIVDILREPLTQGVMKVAGAGTSGIPISYPFVTRFGVTFNTTKPTHQYNYRYEIYRHGVMNARTSDGVFDYMDMNRYAIKLLISNQDIRTRDMVNAMQSWEGGLYDDDRGRIEGKVKFLPPIAFRQLKALCDSTDNDSFIFEPETMEKIDELYAEKRKLFRSKAIEFYCNAFRDHMISILKGMAFINYKYQDEGDKIKFIVKPNLVDFLRQKLERLEEMWGLDEMLLNEEAAEAEKSVLWELMQTISGTLKMDLFKLIAAKEGDAAVAFLCDKTNRTKSSVGNDIRWLVDQHLIFRVKRGNYRPTTRGADAYRMIQEGPDQKQRHRWFREFLQAHRKNGLMTDEIHAAAQERGIVEKQVDDMIHHYYTVKGFIDIDSFKKWRWVD